jgi:hypothetical protein
MDIVVSHFEESLHWLSNISNASVIIYHKGSRHRCSDYANENACKHWKWIKTRNIGREQYTFISHIYHHYNKLSKYNLFLQGNPFSHLQRISFDKKNNFQLLGNMKKSFADGCPHHCGIAVKTSCEKFNVKHCRSPFIFSAGGMWFATREKIQSFPQKNFKKILDAMHVEHYFYIHFKREPIYDYIFERLWFSFFHT